MLKESLFLGLLLISFFSVSSAKNQKITPQAQWTVFNYIEADNNLVKYALYNLRAMSMVGSTPLVNIGVQLDEPKHKVTWRYKIERKGFSENSSLQQDMGLKPKQEFARGLQWAASTFPSKKLMLILWNHGNGILDEPRPANRGILYDFTNETYLNNQQLDSVLKDFTTNTLKKKIDIIGMDACLMASFEVAYQIKEYAKILIASENIEHVPGWHYKNFLSFLAQSPSAQALPLAKRVVSSFAQFNKKRPKNYTLSAIKLSEVLALKQSFDNVIKKIFDMSKCAPVTIRKMVCQARKKSLEFDAGTYIDLYSFLSQLRIHVRKKPGKLSREWSAHVKQIVSLINKSLVRLKQAVLSKANGRKFSTAGGLTIYYPKKPIHHSYAKTKFSHDSKWLQFITTYKNF
jgi:hypothetical protein